MWRCMGEGEQYLGTRKLGYGYCSVEERCGVRIEAGEASKIQVIHR